MKHPFLIFILGVVVGGIVYAWYRKTQLANALANNTNSPSNTNTDATSRQRCAPGLCYYEKNVNGVVYSGCGPCLASN